MQRLWGVIRTAASRALDVALPPRCPGCGAVTLRPHDFCVDCWSRLDFLGPPACAVCAEPFAQDPGEAGLCGACLRQRPGFDAMRAAVAYGEIARHVVLRLKYGGRPALAETIAARLRALVPQEPGLLIAPVPLHRWRLWRRGYNQSALIARALAKGGQGTLLVDLLERRRATPVLRGLGPEQRRRAVRGAFRTAQRHRPLLKDAHVLLVDDVYTTGATANACAGALRRAGAARITLLCWARVVRNDGPSVDNSRLQQQLLGSTSE